jgi:hypothetical protein
MTGTSPSPYVTPVVASRRAGPRQACADLFRGIALTFVALWEALVLVWYAVAVVLVPVGIGLWLLPGALDLVRVDARRQRVLAGRVGILVPEAYAAEDAGGRGLKAAWRRVLVRLGDPAAWWDLLWHVVNPCLGPLITFLPAAVLLQGLWGIAMPWLWEPVVRPWDGAWYAFVPLHDQADADLAPYLGVVFILLAFVIAGPLARLNARWVRAVLGRQAPVRPAARDEARTPARVGGEG